MTPSLIVVMERLLGAAAIVLAPLPAFAQTAGAPTTGPRQELTVGVGSYNHVEPCTDSGNRDWYVGIRRIRRAGSPST